MKKIYITGISGTGKTTIAKKMEQKGLSVISIDEVPDLCFWIDKETKEKVKGNIELNKAFIDMHDWYCDVNYLRDLMNEAINLVFVLGIASNQNDFLNLFDKTILLQCKPEIFILRIENRIDNNFGKDKSAQESILGWYKKFEEEMIKNGAVSIDAEKSVDEIIEEIVKEVA